VTTAVRDRVITEMMMWAKFSIGVAMIVRDFRATPRQDKLAEHPAKKTSLRFFSLLLLLICVRTEAGTNRKVIGFRDESGELHLCVYVCGNRADGRLVGWLVVNPSKIFSK